MEQQKLTSIRVNGGSMAAHKELTSSALSNVQYIHGFKYWAQNFEFWGFWGSKLCSFWAQDFKA